MRLPSVPLCLAVTVSVPSAAVSVTGRSGCCAACAARAAAISVAVSALSTATCTRSVPTRRVATPEPVAGPVSATEPWAATAAAASSSARQVIWI